MDTSEGMTIREIAEIANTSEKTIREWIKTASEKLPEVLPGLSAKTAEAQETKKPALFTVDEVIAIIRAGGRATLADLLAENARRTAQAALPAPVFPAPAGLKVQEDVLGIYRDIISQQNSLVRNLQRQVKSLERRLEEYEHRPRRVGKPSGVTLPSPDEVGAEEPFLSFHDIATALGCTKENVNHLAAKEGWKFYYHTVFGGKQKRFPLSELPPRIQEAWVKYQESQEAPHAE